VSTAATIQGVALDSDTQARRLNAVAGHAVRPPDDVRFEVTRRGTCTTIAVDGELDLASVGALSARFAGTRLEPGASVIVDLTRCAFIDSSVIAFLIGAEARTEAAGADLVTLVAAGPVQRMLDLAGVCDALTVLQRGQ
jgi:anti-anti-sigma factor